MLWQQLVANGIISAAAYLLVAVGFALTYRVGKFFNFAHGAVFTVGAYSAFFFRTWLHLPLFLSAILGILLGTVLGGLMEFSVYRPLRRRAAAPLVLLLASLGIYIVIQNVISMVFGDDTKSLRAGVVETGFEVLGARITRIQVLMVSASVAVMIALGILLRRMKFGRAMRAVANDHELASVSGVASESVVLWTFAAGSAIAALGGILVALDVDMVPSMGLSALMMGIVAAIIGGLRSILGLTFGALLLGLAQHLGVWKIGSQWQDAIAFLILIAFLLFKPEGFLGRRGAKVAV